MGYLDDRSILVTGGVSGLGRAIVDRFVTEGASVTVLDRSVQGLTELKSEYGQSIRTVVGDVASFDDNVSAADAATSAYGKLDCFIGNVGLWDFSAPLVETDADALSEAFDTLFTVNVKGLLFGAKAAAKPLRQSRGAMIFTLSGAAMFAGGGGVLYTASKHAGVGLVRQLAYELAPEIRVNAVAPGGMSTELKGPTSLVPEGTTITDRIPIDDIMKTAGALQRVTTPSEYVGLYMLLASAEDALTTTGTVFDASSMGIHPRP